MARSKRTFWASTGHGKVGPYTGIVATTFPSDMFVSSISMAFMMVSSVSRCVGSTFLLGVRTARVTSLPHAPPTNEATHHAAKRARQNVGNLRNAETGELSPSPQKGFRAFEVDDAMSETAVIAVHRKMQLLRCDPSVGRQETGQLGGYWS